MARKRVLSPQSVWDEPALRAAFEEHGIKALHIPVLYRYLTRRPEAQWEDVPDLPKAAVALLRRSFAAYTTRVVHTSRSGDGDALKMLLSLQDGLQVESVVMRYEPAGPAEAAAEAAEARPRARSTLCVSSEVGCQMGCTFCATGTMGLTADLTAGEIVEQLVQARRVVTGELGDVSDVGGDEAASTSGAGRENRIAHNVARPDDSTRDGAEACDGASERQPTTSSPHTHDPLPSIRNVVFMGMGEPLNNYAAVRAAIALMTDPAAFALRRSAVTLSTVGVVPRIRQLAADLPGVSLALSLHAPTQELRARIVPSARAYPLPRLMAAVAEYQAASGRRVFVEYVALGDVNCRLEHAHALGRLLAGRDVVVNLIPWNPILSPAMPFQAPAPEQLRAFGETLRREYALPVTVRQEKGQDVAGACGQLVLEHGGRAGSEEAASSRCGKGADGMSGAGASSLCASGGELADLEDLVARPAAVC